MRKHTLNIRRGDEVLVLAGKDRSLRNRPKRGRVIGVLPNKERLLVEGVNIIKRAVRQSQKIRQGGIVESPGPIHISNVMLICPACDKPTRVGHRVREDGRKVRHCKKCNRQIGD
jgi:large subunit ribosomal protein L24